MPFIMDGGSIIMVGYTQGSFVTTNMGSSDAVAIKLEADGIELWRWQVRKETTRRQRSRTGRITGRF